MRPADLARMQRTEEQLAPLNPITARLNWIAERVFEWHEIRWSDDPGKVKAWEEWVKKHPRLYAARERSAAQFLNKILPTKLIHKGEPGSRAKRIKPEDLQALNLSADQLKKLAQFDEDQVLPREENGNGDAG